MSAVTSLRGHSGSTPRSVSSTCEGLGWWGVLPHVTDGNGRWWLPLSDSALVLLGDVLLRSSGDWDSFDPALVSKVAKAFESDPPLFFFAVIRWPGDEMVTAGELAEWLIGAAPTIFAGGDWILAAPEFTEADERHWSRLMVECMAVPASQWMAFAKRWLEVIGPEVPSQWIDAWPDVIWENGFSISHHSGAQNASEGSKLLQRLAQTRQRELATEDSISSLAEKRKLGAAKELAYGLSHEINNPLANISARAQGLLRDEDDTERRRSLDQIVQQVYRAYEMIAGLMFYANPPDPQTQRVDLNELIDRAVGDFLDTAEENDIRLLVEKSPRHAECEVDPAMMTEAVAVLVRNAIEAVGTGGTIVVSVQNGQNGNSVPHWMVHVADSGPGLSPSEARHAFDPYFSGREAGRGLGLGLCRAFRVAKLHQATIRLSAGLAGCVATISIPADH